MANDANAPSAHSRDDEKLLETLLARLAEGAPPPAELARELGWSLLELARWLDASDRLRPIAALLKLADLRAQTLVSRYRAEAAARLIQLATNGDADELARKACVDLLRIHVGGMNNDGKKIGEGADDPPVPSERTILEALERLGREEEADEPRGEDEGGRTSNVAEACGLTLQ